MMLRLALVAAAAVAVDARRGHGGPRPGRGYSASIEAKKCVQSMATNGGRRYPTIHACCEAEMPWNTERCRTGRNPRVTCPDGNTRVRKPWSALTCEERETFIGAANALKKWFPEEFALFGTSHTALFSEAHGNELFLPWHRFFLLMYENALRSLGGDYACVALPYFDSEVDAGTEHDASVFEAGPAGLGSACADRNFAGTCSRPFSGCVNDGGFAGWTAGTTRSCLDRSFRGERGGEAYFPTQAMVAHLIRTTPDYSLFYDRLEAQPHGSPHVFVGGVMATGRSPYDPLFFVHHCNTDRLWALWQDVHGYASLGLGELTVQSSGNIFQGNPNDSDMPGNQPMRFLPEGTDPMLARFLPALGASARQMHNTRNMAGFDVFYAADKMAADNFGDKDDWTWFQNPADLPRFTCAHLANGRAAHEAGARGMGPPRRNPAQQKCSDITQEVKLARARAPRQSEATIQCELATQHCRDYHFYRFTDAEILAAGFNPTSAADRKNFDACALLPPVC